MATRALDAMTILSALEALDHELQATRWKPQNPTQRELFAWLSTYKEQLARITGLEAKASRFYEELNAFLANRGFRLSIATFDSTRELGVVSVLDKLVVLATWNIRSKTSRVRAACETFPVKWIKRR